MRIIIASDYADMSRKAADIISSQVQRKPESVLGLATGTTPIGLYEDLVEDCSCGTVSFARTTTFNLDEYRGIAADHPQSYRHFMNVHLFDHIDIAAERTHVPDGANPDAEAVCTAYEQAILDAGGIDLQLLGLGLNGHVGFNEPHDEFPVRAHCVDLTQSTIEANSRLFDRIDDVPRQAYTMGIGTIMKARALLVVVSGASKAEIVRTSCCGPVIPQVPASVLQLHPNVTYMLDEAAGALMHDMA